MRNSIKNLKNNEEDMRKKNLERMEEDQCFLKDFFPEKLMLNRKRKRKLKKVKKNRKKQNLNKMRYYKKSNLKYLDYKTLNK